MLERRRIAQLRRDGFGVREIAGMIGRSPSTVRRGLRRNMKVHDGGVYDAELAHALARERGRWDRGGWLASDVQLRGLVQEKLELELELELEWSPEQISAWLRQTSLIGGRGIACHETIYQALTTTGKGV